MTRTPVLFCECKGNSLFRNSQTNRPFFSRTDFKKGRTTASTLASPSTTSLTTTGLTPSPSPRGEGSGMRCYCNAL